MLKKWIFHAPSNSQAIFRAWLNQGFFGFFLEIIFLYLKNRHAYQFAGENLQNWIFPAQKALAPKRLDQPVNFIIDQIFFLVEILVFFLHLIYEIQFCLKTQAPVLFEQEKSNFEDFHLQTDMHVYFLDTKNIYKKNPKKSLIQPSSKKDLKLRWSMKNPFFDHMTCLVDFMLSIY